MKKMFLLAAVIANLASASAQISGEFLDINNVKAKINCEGACFNDGINQQFEVPKGSGRHSIFEGAIWIGGIDAANTLKIAGETYRQTGTDFWAGPLNSLATTDSATIYNFSRVWKINKCDIDSYHVWVLAGSTGINPVDSAAMEAILTWPALNPDGSPLAPYIDFNTNGIYDPYAGDMPDIKGDQAIFFVYNDKGGVHTETGGAALGVEIQGMAYAYSCINDSALYNTIFTHYKIINKSSFRIDSTFIGNWTDFDIGSANDDYIGCDVTRGAYYGYNGDMTDDFPPAGQLAYGSNPPAQAVVFLAGPWADSNGVDDAASITPNGNNFGDGIVDNERLGMSRFHYYNNDPSLTGNPTSAVGFYEYMVGSWNDGTAMTYGGTGHLTGLTCDYMYPGNSDPLGFGTGMIPQSPWDETTSGDIPADRRGVGSYGPFTFQPGAIQEFDFAYVFARATSGGNLASVSLLQERIDSVRQKFNGLISTCGCSGTAGSCHANFNIVQDSTNLFNYWVYDNSTITGTTTYLWDFGDGTNSTVAYPSHTYAVSSPVYLCLTISNGSCSDMYCDSINPGHSSGVFTINVVPSGIHEQISNVLSFTNYPNPFNGETTISYSISNDAYVELSVWDLLGNKVASIENENKSSGSHTIIWNSEGFSKGMYLLRLNLGSNASTKKLIIN